MNRAGHNICERNANSFCNGGNSMISLIPESQGLHTINNKDTTNSNQELRRDYDVERRALTNSKP